ncbi:MAG: hypothetical protein K8S00_07985, partial [Bacteroidales bacterium]|nr:hypothetical protein [Bacteroidales bacterium]
MENNKSVQEFDKELVLKLVLSAVPAVFWVIFLWSFWSKGIYALGFNATIFFFLLLGLFIWVLYKKKYYISNDLLWIIPMVLITLSYLIYDNPFLKIFSLLILPVMFAVFYNQAFSSDKKNRLWDLGFVLKIVERLFSFLPRIGQSITLYLNLIIPSGKTKNRVIVRAISGVILFLIIAFTVFIP